MGSDDLHHKRKAKLQSEMRRREAIRAPYQKVLIVCEGEKTEPLYFNEIKDKYEINSANITVSGECGSDPLSVYSHAADLFQKENDKNDPFDRVYCVFDQDGYNLGPNKYQQAIDKISRSRPKDTFIAITSVPCFEYWFLLHFVYTTAPFTSVGKYSVGDSVRQELLKYWPEYQKTLKDTFEFLFPNLERAKAYSKRALTAASRNHTDNPSTYVHDLVDYLQHIKEEK